MVGGRFKGFAFVEFEDHRDAKVSIPLLLLLLLLLRLFSHSLRCHQDAVYDMDNRKFGGRTLKVCPRARCSRSCRSAAASAGAFAAIALNAAAHASRGLIFFLFWFLQIPPLSFERSKRFLNSAQVELSKRPPASNWNELSRRREER